MVAYGARYDHLEAELDLLSKHRTYTITPLALLRVHFKFGYLSTEKSDRKKGGHLCTLRHTKVPERGVP